MFLRGKYVPHSALCLPRLNGGQGVPPRRTEGQRPAIFQPGSKRVGRAQAQGIRTKIFSKACKAGQSAHNIVFNRAWEASPSTAFNVTTFCRLFARWHGVGTLFKNGLPTYMCFCGTDPFTKISGKNLISKTPNSVRGQACRLEWRLLRPPLAPARRTASSHQIRFHSVVGAPLHQRNLAAFSPAAFDARHRLFPGSQVHRQRRGKCHG